MDPNGSQLFVQWIVLGICFILSAFFSCSETALMAVSRIRMRTLVEDGNNKAALVEKLLDDNDALLSTILIGNNVVNIGASALSTLLAIHYYGNAGAGIATGIVTIIVLIFGEITPKSLAVNHCEAVSMSVAPIIATLVFVLKPFVFILNLITKALVTLLGGKQEIQPTVSEDDLKTFATVSHEEGVIEEEDMEMIHNVVDFGDTEIREIMTPRVHVVDIQDDITYQELLEVYREQRFSRIPVVSSEDNDYYVGVLNVKDLILANIDPEHFDVRRYLREPVIVYEFNHLKDAFEKLRSQKKSSLAIVLDEYGIMSGIVTIEDMIEEIVGEIDDEYDEEELSIVPIGEDSYIVDGSMSFIEINEALGTKFESEAFESIGGLVLGELGEIELHKELEIQGALLSIEKAERNHIEKVKLTILPEKEDDTTSNKGE